MTHIAAPPKTGSEIARDRLKRAIRSTIKQTKTRLVNSFLGYDAEKSNFAAMRDALQDFEKSTPQRLFVDADGKPVSRDATRPYSLRWDTAAAPEGPHELVVYARGAHGPTRRRP